MLTLATRSLWTYKRRVSATLLAVVLGVAFLAGTLLLSDTLRANFDRLFTRANATTDVILRGATKIGSGFGPDARVGVDAGLLPAVRGVAGVADAQPYVEGSGQLVGGNGTVIGGNGPPRRAANWIIDPALNPYRLASGRAPRADDEAVVDRGAATAGHLRLGQVTTLLTPQPLRVRIVWIATFGDADGFGSSTFTGLTLRAAQQHLTGSDPGRISQVLVKADPGVSPDELAGRIRPVLPGSVQAITGAELAAENLDQIDSGFLGFLSTGLTAFAAIALLVTTFSIHNTFSILAAQRGRESALLRALGASRRQLVGAGVVEALAVGCVGAAVGWAGGIGIAALLKGVFDGFGFALPAGGLVFTAGSAVLAVGAGLAATLLAGVVPAVRASRVPPLAALRDLAAEPARASRRRLALGSVLSVAGVATVVAAAGGGQAGAAIAGAVGLLTGVLVLGPAVARPAAAVLGAPIAALRGVTGQLSRENALRNPARTAASASALMVGVTVVALFTVIGASLKASAAHGVDRTLRAALVVDQGGYGGRPGSTGLGPGLVADLARLPSVQVASGVSTGSTLLAGHTRTVTAADPRTLGQVVDLGLARGSLADLAPGTLAVSATAADDQHWRLGTTVPVTYPDGTTASLRVAAVYDHPDVTGDYLLPTAGWAPHAGQTSVSQILLTLRPGSDLRATQAAVTAATAGSGRPRVQDRAAYKASATSGVTTILGLVYVMLALAVLISLMGIANTLSLSIHERTRELGLLRAVGQTTAQARAMIRWESVVVAVLGTLAGVVLGTFLGWALVTASSTSALGVFSAPPWQLATFLLVGAAAGILAGIRPARRAARLDPLTAVATS